MEKVAKVDLRGPSMVGRVGLRDPAVKMVEKGVITVQECWLAQKQL